MITARAKVNVAAVNYHFGSKALTREVFQRHLAPLNQAASPTSIVWRPTRVVVR
jgi:AcrR family transcriptional regulator